MKTLFRLRLIVLLLVLCCVSIAGAQSGISVKSFTELSQDLDARVSYPELDQNGHKCALVKVYTTESNFSFDNGLLGVTKVIHKPELSEWWVYLPAKTMKLKIMHPQLGHLKDSEGGYYYFPSPLKEATCYYMELTTAKVTVVVEEERKQTGFLIINSQPEGADVYLTEDGVENYAGQTPFQKKLTYGSYNYRLKKSLYHDEVGVTVVDNTRVEQKIVLRPAFGSLRITSTPSGAKVSLQNDLHSYTTPCTIEHIPSGQHQVSIVAPRYASFSRVVDIIDGQQTELDATLDARFATVTINSLPGATIKVNGQEKGRGSCSEELGEGIYDIEVSLKSHRSVTRQIEVVAKQPQTLTIEPTPIYGMLDIMTNPMYANVTINGKSYGDTPLSIEKMLIGDYEVVLSKTGYASVTKRVTITENNLSTVEATLPQGREMTIRSDASGDEVFVDGTKVGVTPLTTNLAFGNHTIELHRAGKTTKTDVNITTSGKEKEIVLSFGLMPRWSAKVTASQKAVLQKLIDSMVSVEGGTFTMGATSEQGSEADSDEKPTHKVTLSDYMIAKTEVTQELWQAVLGSNPSELKGDKLPVECVSWNDCQEFIKKLNSLTGLNFRLPTEAEWEYAARGGNKSKGCKYSGSNDIGSVAWYEGNSSSKTHTVATKSPNELGIYDMSGNVWEWCSDWYGDYSSSSQTNPKGPSSGSYRVIRGGSWDDIAGDWRVSDRYFNDPDGRVNALGLRLAL
ncbi:MAG: SUMF1/EgtB/PvdO family nonheme iron enzyme [Muribaculaceae bacterium]|nr:SUMF1/EgtB/PvdO family nonheme iron enzyme [Muribaculaceae bacterium]